MATTGQLPKQQAEGGVAQKKQVPTGLKHKEPVLLGVSGAEKLKIHGRTLLEYSVGPKTDQTNLKDLENKIRSIKHNGIDEWTVAQKEDVGFGINRLNIGVIIKDDEVDWEDIKELVLSNTRDLIQSVDLLGIHKAKIVNE